MKKSINHMCIPSLDIIIVNWNAGKQISDCIKSIAETHQDRFELNRVIIVDNASIDGSVDSLELLDDLAGNKPFPLQIIRNKENRGFAAACNQGAALARSEYLLFLNPDTQLFKNSLAVPLAFMQHPQNTNVGICSIQMVDETGMVSRSCARFPSVRLFTGHTFGVSKIPSMQAWSHQMVEWDHGVTREVDQLIGAFFFIRTKVFKELNGFDERFFVYFEEVDLTFRARQAGYRSVYLAEAQAFHAGGGTSRQIKDLRLFYNLRSRLLYGFKHFSRSKAIILIAITLLIEPVSRIIFALGNDGITDVRNTLRAYKLLWHDLSTILKKGFDTP